MLKSIQKKQLGVQVLEYGLLGAIMVAGGAYATGQLSDQSVAKTGVVGNCLASAGAKGGIGVTSSAADGKASAANCNTSSTPSSTP